jgi:anti-anti-sigma factor
MAMFDDFGTMKMKVGVVPEPGRVVVRPVGPINSVTAASFGHALLSAIDQTADPVEIDLKEVPYASSAAFRMLLMAIERLDQRNQRLQLSNVEQLVHKALEMGNFTSLVDVLS